MGPLVDLGPERLTPLSPRAPAQRQAKTKQVPRVKTLDGFYITYEEVLTLCVPEEDERHCTLQLHSSGRGPPGDAATAA